MATMHTPRTPEEAAAEKAAERKFLTGVAVFLVSLFGFVYWSHLESKKQIAAEKAAAAEAERACMKDPKCSDDAARDYSKSQRAPIVSPATGALFFRGMRCSHDCSGHVAGYEWARDLGVTNGDACPYDNGDSFGSGCRIAADENYRDIRFDLGSGY